jgi:hypothetical protein
MTESLSFDINPNVKFQMSKQIPNQKSKQGCPSGIIIYNAVVPCWDLGF